MNITHLDHLVLTVTDIDRSLNFYSQVMGMQIITFGDNRKALQFGQQKINLHLAGHEFEPKAHTPTVGSADLCFISSTPMPDILKHLEQNKIQPLIPPSYRTGTKHKLLSVYFRDPDNNLIEVSNYVLDETAD